jgi:hypothetical protein
MHEVQIVQWYVHYYGLFSEAVSSSDYTASNGSMISE